MPTRQLYPYTSAMQQVGMLPYELGGMGVAGVVFSGLPQAFLSGLDIARALQQEEWQRKMYEQQLKYTQGANLLNMLFESVAKLGNIEEAKKMLTPEQKQMISQVIGFDVEKFLESLPTLEQIYPGADYSIVGEKTKKLGYWLSNLYTTLPGNAVKDIFGEKTISAEGKEIVIDPKKLYVLPVGYQQLWGKKQQLEFNKLKLSQQLALYRDKLAQDEKLKAVKTSLDYSRKLLEAGEIEASQKHLRGMLESLKEIFKEKTGYELDVDPSIFEESDVNWLKELIDTIKESLGVTKTTSKSVPYK